MKGLLFRIGNTLVTAFFVTILVTLVLEISDPTFRYTDVLSRLFAGHFGLGSKPSDPIMGLAAVFAGETLALILIAFFIAVAVGSVVALASARWSRRIADTVATFVRCTPFVVIMLLFFALIDIYRSDPSRLIFTICAVALYQLPPVIDWLSRNASADGRNSMARSVWGLAWLFTEKLPGTLAAALLAEVSIHRGAGDAVFFQALDLGDLPAIAAMVTIAALFVLFVRFVVDVFLPSAIAATLRDDA
jgi:ABC-type dipeptide/oligopeptide/nickel transport system permease component